MLQIAPVYGAAAEMGRRWAPGVSHAKVLNFSGHVSSGWEDACANSECEVASGRRGRPALPTLGFAHHALQSEFDITNPSHRWTGTLRSVQWINPHSRFVIDVADESGKVTT